MNLDYHVVAFNGETVKINGVEQTLRSMAIIALLTDVPSDPAEALKHGYSALEFLEEKRFRYQLAKLIYSGIEDFSKKFGGRSLADIVKNRAAEIFSTMLCGAFCDAVDELEAGKENQ